MSLFVEPYRIIPVMGDYAVARAQDAAARPYLLWLRQL